MKIKNTKVYIKNLNLILVIIGIVIITAGIIVLSMSGCMEKTTEPANVTEEKIVTGDNAAKINIKLAAGDEEGSLEYILMGSKKYPFENEIIGMKIGDKKNVNYSESFAVRLSQEPKENAFYMGPRGEFKVFNVTDTEIFIGDKLAGETLNFSITVKNAEDVKRSRKTCLLKYNVSIDTVAFYHTNSCPHCIKMKPWVENMENNSYKFLWIEGSDNEKMKIAQECLKDVLNFGEGVPQFGCPSNAKFRIGEFRSIDEMKNFTEECKKAAEEIIDEEAGEEMIVRNGYAVEVEYVGKLLNGEKFDEGTTKFVTGSERMIKGFEEAVIGMKINESKEVIVPPEKAYGFPEAISREMPQDIPIDSFKEVFNEDPVLNKKYTKLQSIPWPVKVVEIKTTNYSYSIEILDIMTKEEYKKMSCLEMYGISKDTIAFYHTDTCSYCTKMMPWVEDMENIGYKFLWIEESDNEKMKIANECLAGVLNFGEGVPQFGCPSNGKLHIGAFKTIDEMKDFAGECRNAIK